MAQVYFWKAKARTKPFRLLFRKILLREVLQYSPDLAICYPCCAIWLSQKDWSTCRESALTIDFFLLEKFQFKATIFAWMREIVFPKNHCASARQNHWSELAETVLLNILNLIAHRYQAARMRSVAARILSDFGLRRAQGIGATTRRGSDYGGFNSTARKAARDSQYQW